MDAILIATNPGWVTLFVAGTFQTAPIVTGFRVLDGPTETPNR